MMTLIICAVVKMPFAGGLIVRCGNFPFNQKQMVQFLTTDGPTQNGDKK